jgi:hypothetical protein
MNLTYHKKHICVIFFITLIVLSNNVLFSHSIIEKRQRNTFMKKHAEELISKLLVSGSAMQVPEVFNLENNKRFMKEFGNIRKIEECDYHFNIVGQKSYSDGTLVIIINDHLSDYSFLCYSSGRIISIKFLNGKPAIRFKKIKKKI